MCRSIAHELGHSFGLLHTTGSATIDGSRVDMMCEHGDCVNAAATGTAKWDTVNRKMTKEVSGCGGSTQNTYAKLMETLGVRR